MDFANMGIMSNMVQPSTSTMASHMITKKDSDSDSSLTIDEMGVSEDIFSSIDSDTDGLLSQSELTTAIDTAMSQFDGEMPSKEEFQSVLSTFGFEAPASSNNTNLSDSQFDTISSVLENYDSSSLSQSDAQAIVAAFEEAGIQASPELEAAMEEAGFSAQEVGTLAGVGQAQGGTPPPGGGGNPMASSEEEEVYDVMDTDEDGTVSLEEIQEYYGTSSDNTTQELSANQQNALDNLEFLMETLKSSDEDVDSSSFDGILKTINTQNNNSQINTYLQDSNASSMFGYA